MCPAKPSNTPLVSFLPAAKPNLAGSKQVPVASSLINFSQLCCSSNFSFLTGASHPQELVSRAVELGYQSIAITDECTVAGIVRAYEAAKDASIKLIIGSQFYIPAEINGASRPMRLVLLAKSRLGYSQLCHLISKGRRQASKGSYRLQRSDFETSSEVHDNQQLTHCIAILLPENPEQELHETQAQWLKQHFPANGFIGYSRYFKANDSARLQRLLQVAAQAKLTVAACPDVLMHSRERRALQDVLTATRLKTTVANAGLALQQNGERYLQSLQVLVSCYPAELLLATSNIAGQCQFCLSELNYQYPHEITPDGISAPKYLRRLVIEGLNRRYPKGADWSLKRKVLHELKIIGELQYEAFFLTVYDVVKFARSQGILCQGRGSAANSLVCYCLGVTEVSPRRSGMLFERFMSKERDEPPDIDVDFEHQRREEVLQYIFNKYGRERAAIAATVSSYRTKSAVRDVAKALGFSMAQIEQINRHITWWDKPESFLLRLQEQGFDTRSRVIEQMIYLTNQISGFPRHLSQHVGGFVISETPLAELVPVENAAMADRTVIQWDKDDLETLGLLKVDCLALGMLSAVHRSFDLIKYFYQRDIGMDSIPEGDAATYAMIQKADTVGVFQIESRAQMSMLPRLKPKCFYDLVIEVAIVRPGPIQGDMVHPYLRRRNGEEPVSYPSDALEKVLERTLGVPIFQEQVIEIAMVAANFSPGEADQLRRAMAAWKRRGGLEHFYDRFIQGMLNNNYERAFADRIFEQMKGFGEYGFPESHSASFALLVYASAWLKCHYPAAFTCALLNSLPMGFYSASQLVRDARRHGIRVRPVDLRFSEWESTLEADPAGEAVVRLGLCRVKGLSQDSARQLIRYRQLHELHDLQHLVQHSQVPLKHLKALNRAGALKPLSGHRHRGNWELAGAEVLPELIADSLPAEQSVAIKVPTAIEDLFADYSSTGVSVEKHPMQFLRGRLRGQRCISSKQIPSIAHGNQVRIAGLITMRQRPATAKGTLFITLEDEYGLANIIVWSSLWEKQRQEILNAQVMMVDGRLETEGSVYHVIAHRVYEINDWLGDLKVHSRNFH